MAGHANCASSMAAPQMGDGEAADVAQRAALSRRQLSNADGNGVDASRPAQRAGQPPEPRRRLLDVRSPEEYSGERVSEYSFPVDHGAMRHGRIPGAVHLYFKELLTRTIPSNHPESFATCSKRSALIGAI